MKTTETALRLAQRMSKRGTEGAFEVLARAKQLESEGREIIHLEIGEPDFPTPPHVTEAAVQALRDGWTHYGPPAGLPKLREAVAEDAGRRRGIRVDPSQVIITPGAKPVFFFFPRVGREPARRESPHPPPPPPPFTGVFYH